MEDHPEGNQAWLCCLPDWLLCSGRGSCPIDIIRETHARLELLRQKLLQQYIPQVHPPLDKEHLKIWQRQIVMFPIDSSTLQLWLPSRSRPFTHDGHDFVKVCRQRHRLLGRRPRSRGGRRSQAPAGCFLRMHMFFSLLSCMPAGFRCCRNDKSFFFRMYSLVRRNSFLSMHLQCEFNQVPVPVGMVVVNAWKFKGNWHETRDNAQGQGARSLSSKTYLRTWAMVIACCMTSSSCRRSHQSLVMALSWLPLLTRLLLPLGLMRTCLDALLQSGTSSGESSSLLAQLLRLLLQVVPQLHCQ